MMLNPIWEIVYSTLVVSANGCHDSVSVLSIAFRNPFRYCVCWKMEVLS